MNSLELELAELKEMNVRAKGDAIKSATICIGDNGEDLIESLNADNVIHKRNAFLNNVSHNGARSHEHIIRVLQYMSRFIVTF